MLAQSADADSAVHTSSADFADRLAMLLQELKRAKANHEYSLKQLRRRQATPN